MGGAAGVCGAVAGTREQLAMITIFTIPRGFVGEFDHIQRNALKSWALLKPRPEIMLFGQEDGVGEAAADLGIEQWYSVARNEHGTPLVSDAFRVAWEKATNEILVMANADNIYMSDFIPAIRACARSFPRFMMIGRRWDLQVDEVLDFSGGWEERLRERVRSKPYLHPKAAVDYLAYRDGSWLLDLPPFAVGRTGYDNDIVARTIRAGVPVVDATKVVTVIHQDHTPGKRHTSETRKNRDMRIRGRGGTGMAGWILTGEGDLWRLAENI
jgi:hypothetical protein